MPEYCETCGGNGYLAVEEDGALRPGTPVDDEDEAVCPDCDGSGYEGCGSPLRLDSPAGEANPAP